MFDAKINFWSPLGGLVIWFCKILLRKKLRADWGQEMLASVGAESFVFQVDIKKFEDQVI